MKKQGERKKTKYGGTVVERPSVEGRSTTAAASSLKKESEEEEEDHHQDEEEETTCWEKDIFQAITFQPIGSPWGVSGM